MDRASQFLPTQDPVHDTSQGQGQAPNVQVLRSDEEEGVQSGNEASYNQNRNATDNVLDRQVEEEIRKLQSLLDASGPTSQRVNPDGQIAHLTASSFSEV